MSAVENLKAAREWLGEGEHRWTKGCYGVNEDGVSVVPERATACCALGALFRVDDTDRSAEDFLYCVCRELVSNGLVNYNDAPTTTYADILALYDRAIELAEQAEGGAS